jgi:hypothetical protein
MSDYVPLLVGLILVVLVGRAMLAGKSSAKALPVVPRRLMSPREREAIVMIEAAVPHCRVHAQVSMGALMECRKGLSRKESTGVRNRFDRKIIDFVLEERSSGDVLALVELDDGTHNAAKDRARDAMTRAAGYRTIRLRKGMPLNPASVRAEIQAGLSQETVALAA